MYFVKYGKEYLHDPRTDDVLLTSPSGEVELNCSGTFNFTINYSHPLFGKLIERNTEEPVFVYNDDELIFFGDIIEAEQDFQLSQHIQCRGALAWLNDTIVRPYSTLEGECNNIAPGSVDGYFEWLIENHNAQVEPSKRFKIGKNEGSLLDANNYIYRSDSTYPTTGQVVEDKILESLGGYIQVRREDGVNYLDLLADFETVNAQVIEFGENLLDFAQTDNTDVMATFIVPLGKELEDQEDAVVKKRLTVESIADKWISDDYYKSGDMIYCESATKKHGWIGAVVEFDDVTEADNLLDKGLTGLKALISPVRTIELKAVDKSFYKDEFQYILPGHYVRAKADPYNFDSYMLCSRLEFDLAAPENNAQTLGQTFDRLTGVQNKRINSLNATINTVYESASQISAEAKAAAIVAGQAKETATEAATKAQQAENTASEAKDAANAVSGKADQAVEDAKAAKELADNANAQVTLVQSGVTEAKQAAAQAVSKATEAESAVKSATDKANEAQAAAQAAQTEAGSATDKANAAQTAAGEAKAAASDASITAAAAKLDAEKAQEDIANLGEQLETVSNTMTADYARKTDLTETTANLQSQITQNAAQITSTVSRLTEVDETANDAAEQAAAAQGKANEAATAAAGAQSTADTAKVNAATAQTKANEAATAASNAQKAADEADAKAAQAAANLATAQQNLENVTSRVGATEDEIAAAQAAVETAQAAADKAKADAAAAQSTADTAKTNAANAKTAADNAKSAADAAQADADAARAAADKAQGDVNALTTRVTSAETKITQNSDAIALRATKTEVAQTLSGYYTKTEADAAIQVSANSITQSVSSTYATKSELNKKADDYSILLYNGTKGNPKPVKFTTVNYSTCNSENGVCIKIGMVSGHGNGTSYAFLQDATIRVNHNGGVEVDNVKHYGANAGTYDGAVRQYGDIFWVVDTTNKVVDFYCLMGQYARVYQTPWKRLTYSTGGTVTQYTSCTVYSSGTKAWANNSDIALMSDITELSTRISQTESDITLCATKTELTAVSNAASAAQSTANTAKTNAATAQSAAEAAQSTANTANSTANSVKTDLANNYYTKSQTEAKIEVSADAINSTVSELQTDMETNYATKSEVTQTANGLSVSIQTAQTTANDANTAAGEAQTKANEAASAASTAQSTANTAKDNAATAQSTANTAKDNAATAQSTADTAKTNAATAQNTANTARTEAANAAKTATNFMSYDSSGGLQVGNKTSGSWSGFRTQITSSAFNILNSSGTVLASYGAKLVELGKNAADSVIKLCGGKGSISVKEGYTADVEGQGFLTIESDYLQMKSSGRTSVYTVSEDDSGNVVSKSAVNVDFQYVDIFTEYADPNGNDSGSSSIWLDANRMTLNSGDINITSRSDLNIGSVAGDINIDSNGGEVTIDGKRPILGTTDDTYWGLTNPDGTDKKYMRTTIDGIIPYKYGGGTSQLGTTTWPFSSIHGKNIYANGRNLCENKVLFSGAWYGGASGNPGAITLSDAISSQPHGIVLIFSEYINGVEQDSGWSYFFVPKQCVNPSKNGGTNFATHHYGGSTIMAKYLYIRDTTINGWANNGFNESGYHSNSSFVLRYVIGV